MTRKAWIAIGGLSALSFFLAVALAISLASGDDSDGGVREAGAPAGFAPPGGDQFGGPMGAPIQGPPEELRECLEDEGVELPEPGQAPSEQDQDAIQDAFESCADKLPQGGPSPPGGMIEP